MKKTNSLVAEHVLNIENILYAILEEGYEDGHYDGFENGKNLELEDGVYNDLKLILDQFEFGSGETSELRNAVENIRQSLLKY